MWRYIIIAINKYHIAITIHINDDIHIVTNNNLHININITIFNINITINILIVIVIVNVIVNVIDTAIGFDINIDVTHHHYLFSISSLHNIQTCLKICGYKYTW